MHARFYNPQLGRFLSVDPHDILRKQFGPFQEREEFQQYLREPQSWNRYAYVKGNPLKYIDPDGEAAVAAMSTPYIFTATSGANAGALAGLGPGAALAGASLGGYWIGTQINQIPGVSESISGALVNVLFASTIAEARDFINRKIGTVEGHIGAGGKYPSFDPNDPFQRGDMKGVYNRMKQHLRQARETLGDLPKRQRKEFEELIRHTESQLERWWRHGAI